MAQPNTNLVGNGSGKIQNILPNGPGLTTAFGGNTGGPKAPADQNVGNWFTNFFGIGPAQAQANQAYDQSKKVQGLLQTKLQSGTSQPGTVVGANDPTSVYRINQPQIAQPAQPTAPVGGGLVGTGAATGGQTAGQGTQTTPDKVAIQKQLDEAQAKLQTLLNQNQAQATNQGGTAGIIAPPQQGAINTQAPLTVGGLVPELLTNANATAEVNAAKQRILDLQNQMALASNIGAGTNLAEFQGQQGALQNTFGIQQQAAQQALTTSQEQQRIQQEALKSALGAVAPTAANVLGFYQPGTNQFTEYGGGTGGGGAAKGGAVGQQVNQGAAVQDMAVTQKRAQGLAQNLSAQIDAAGINPALPGSLKLAQTTWNGVLKWINEKTGDPQYKNFANLINEISGAYAHILNQSGGTPTDQSDLSHQIISALASGKDIKTVLGMLDENATKSIEQMRGGSMINAYGTGGEPQTGGQTTTIGTPAEGTTQSAGGYNWTFKNGKWEVAK